MGGMGKNDSRNILGEQGHPVKIKAPPKLSAGPRPETSRETGREAVYRVPCQTTRTQTPATPSEGGWRIAELNDVRSPGWSSGVAWAVIESNRLRPRIRRIWYFPWPSAHASKRRDEGSWSPWTDSAAQIVSVCFSGYRRSASPMTQGHRRYGSRELPACFSCPQNLPMRP